MRLFFENNWLYLVSLKVGTKVIVAQYNYLYGDKIYSYSVGFDLNWKEYRVGAILQMLMIEDAISIGLSEFDFLRGNEEYKYYWTKKDRESVDIVIWKSKLQRLICAWERKIRRIARFFFRQRLIMKIYEGYFLRREEKGD
ncbi:MAG: GNAT family N-acetyltransferase [Spirochaetes bacterium]|nr:GNAT family N-acetyltransferase [Spirochaetota bacterium]